MQCPACALVLLHGWQRCWTWSEVQSCCRGTNEGALWDVHASRRSNSFGGRAAYAGEDGELTMALQAWCQDNRQRAPHYVYAGGCKGRAPCGSLTPTVQLLK